MYKSLNSLNERIIRCVKCKRLVNFRESVALKKTKRFIKDNYWGKPVIGFGDPNAKIIIVGLAPAAHGGNRTGRVFTGDKSADFLFKCLYQAKLSNQPYSIHSNDGLILKNVYMTPALKCVPPEDKPKAEELKKCFIYLSEEISYLENAKIILALGKIAFESCVKLFNLKPSLYQFIHGAEYSINKKLKILACYHPSPRNVNTGRINEAQMVEVLNIVRKC
ncbi:MAG: uracil-DNA glycosylase [Alphaproteobacteria bacterium]|nr:MAG: uracil-DNA glycosylase [Alphaproteobacteria bacterium]